MHVNENGSRQALSATAQGYGAGDTVIKWLCCQGEVLQNVLTCAA
jgi:hypothetical protein